MCDEGVKEEEEEVVEVAATDVIEVTFIVLLDNIIPTVMPLLLKYVL